MFRTEQSHKNWDDAFERQLTLHVLLKLRRKKNKQIINEYYVILETLICCKTNRVDIFAHANEVILIKMDQFSHY